MTGFGGNICELCTHHAVCMYAEQFVVKSGQIDKIKTDGLPFEKKMECTLFTQGETIRKGTGYDNEGFFQAHQRG